MLVDEDVARLATLEGSDDAQALELIHQAPGARVAHLETPLEQRGGALLVRHDEPMTIEKDMNIVVHPTYIHAGFLNWLCDNYIIGGNGPGDRIHQFPEVIVEIDV